jgi:hypothetical protein
MTGGIFNVRIEEEQMDGCTESPNEQLQPTLNSNAALRALISWRRG